MNGGEALLATLVGCDVDVCFANPGTSEMHLVAALDRVPRMRAVLTLFEGVATGAADGYARVAGRPAATLLHLGPGLGNGIANLHNARRAHSPVVNVVGDHATYHKRLDPPLESDLVGLAGTVSGWVRVLGQGRDPGRRRGRGRGGRPRPAGVRGHPGGAGRRSRGPSAPEARPRPSPSGARRRWPGRRRRAGGRRAAARAGRPPSSSAARRCAGGAWWRPGGWPRPPGPGSCARPSRPTSSAGRGCPRPSG